jgi:hypothetical protein
VGDSAARGGLVPLTGTPARARFRSTIIETRHHEQRRRQVEQRWRGRLVFPLRPLLPSAGLVLLTSDSWGPWVGLALITCWWWPSWVQIVKRAVKPAPPPRRPSPPRKAQPPTPGVSLRSRLRAHRRGQPGPWLTRLPMMPQPTGMPVSPKGRQRRSQGCVVSRIPQDTRAEHFKTTGLKHS